MAVNIPSQIVVQTVVQWAADATVYAAKRILVTSNATYGGTDQRKFKIADGTQTWAQLDYFPAVEPSALTAYQLISEKNSSGGYVGLTALKINFINALNTFTSFLVNSNTAARTYTFQNRDGTIADLTDVAQQAESIAIACADETTSMTTGTKVTFRMPFAMTLTSVRGSLTTAATGATLFQFDIQEAGVTIFSTKPTFDASATTTVGAATPNVISDTALADNAVITIIVDAIGNTLPGVGLKVYLNGTRT